MFAAVLLSCATLLCACVLVWLQGRRARSLTRHLPGFPPLPLIGNVHQIMGDSHYIFNIVCKISKMMDDANAPFFGWIGPRPFMLVSSPEDVKAVTNAFIEKPYYYNFARDYVGNGLVTAPGAIWKRSIKKLGGTFSGSIVEGYQGVFNAQAQRLVHKLRAEVGKEPFDAMKKYLAFTTLESICQTALGIPGISDSIVTTEYYSAFVRVFELLVKRIRNLFMHVDFIYRLSPDYRELMKCVAVLHDVSHTMFVFVILSCAILVGAYAVLWRQGRRARTLTRHLPSFPTLPLIGNAHQLLGDSQFLFTKLLEVSKISDEANTPFVGCLGPSNFLLVSSPEDIKAVTNAFIEKPYYYNFAREYAGNGLVTAPGDIWKHSIKKIGGAFSGSVVEGYQGVFNAQAQRLVRKLRAEVGKAPFDAMKKYLAFTTLESICQTALGISSEDSIVTVEYYAAFIRVFELLAMRLRNLFFHLDFIHRFSGNYREMRKSVTVLHNASDKIMKSRRKEREALKAMGSNHQVNLENDKTKFTAFLDILFDLQDVDPTFTDEQIRSEVSTLIVGGQETVATTLFMSMLMLGCKPDIQKRLYAEMKEIFGNSKRTVEKEDLAKMQYSEAVLCETLRMFPPIPIVGRLADHDLQLRDCLVSEGTVCGINLLGAGRSKHTWGPDADKYRPDRWLSEDCPGLTPSNFLAFSYGKRSCIGKRYAMPIMKTILAHCVREFVFKSEAENLKLKIDVGLKAHSGHLMTLQLRS